MSTLNISSCPSLIPTTCVECTVLAKYRAGRCCDTCQAKAITMISTSDPGVKVCEVKSCSRLHFGLGLICAACKPTLSSDTRDTPHNGRDWRQREAQAVRTSVTQSMVDICEILMQVEAEVKDKTLTSLEDHTAWLRIPDLLKAQMQAGQDSLAAAAHDMVFMSDVQAVLPPGEKDFMEVYHYKGQCVKSFIKKINDTVEQNEWAATKPEREKQEADCKAQGEIFLAHVADIKAKKAAAAAYVHMKEAEIRSSIFKKAAEDVEHNQREAAAAVLKKTAEMKAAEQLRRAEERVRKLREDYAAKL